MGKHDKIAGTFPVTCDPFDGHFVVTVWSDGGPITRETYADETEAEARAALFRRVLKGAVAAVGEGR